MRLGYERRQAVAAAIHDRVRYKDTPAEFFHAADTIALPTCRSCIYFEDYGNGNGGECRRRSPAVGKDGRHMWPVVSQDDWCGDYQRFDPAALAERASLPAPPDLHSMKPEPGDTKNG